MSKKALLPQSPRHILIYDEDWELLETCFGPAGLKPVGISTVLRALIHQYSLSIREKQNAANTISRRNIYLNKDTSNATTPLSSPSGSSSGEHI